MLKAFIWILIVFIQIMPSLALCGDIRGAILEGKLKSVVPSRAKWAVSVVDMDSGKEIVNIGNSNGVALVPASLVKLFVTGAVLEYAEKNGGLDMTTTILHDGVIEDGLLKGNLYIIGRGNAMLSARNLEKAAGQISAIGIRKIEGGLIADDTLFDGSGIGRKRKGPAYAPPSALGLDLHTVAVTVIPGQAGDPPKVIIVPANDNVTFSVSAKTVPGVRNTIRIKKISDVSYIIEGNIPEGSGMYKKRFALDDPALYAAGVMKTVLMRGGIAVEGDIKKGKSPDATVKLAEIKAPALNKIINDMNINSLNAVADNLLLLLGANRFGAPGTVEAGVKAVEEFVAEVQEGDGPMNKGFHMADGSGLSNENKITARFMADYLQAVSKRPWFKPFKESLARPGMDGRARNIPYKNPDFSVKTGQLEDAYALAGYGVGSNDRPFAFTYMVNGNRGEIMASERSGAMVMETLAGN